MKKKIPLSLLVSGVLLIFILGLLWANPAQGKPDPTRLKGDPWGHMKSPPILEDPNMDLVLIVIDLDFALFLSLPHLDSHSDQQEAGISE